MTNNYDNKNFNQIKDMGKTPSDYVYERIYRNPIVRDLPELASQYGLYSTFMVGMRGLYFIYGFNKELILNGEFIEYQGNMYSEEVVNRIGYSSPAATFENVYARDYNSVLLDDRCIVKGGINKIGENFVYLEFFKSLYERHGMYMPEFIYGFDFAIRKLILSNDVTNNPALTQRGKANYPTQEKTLLNDIAIWEWPISDKSKKPGVLGFLASRYASGMSDIKKIEKLYQSAYKWDRTLTKTEDYKYLAVFEVETKEYDYIHANLEKLHIPSLTILNDKDIKIVNENENKLFNEAIYQNMEVGALRDDKIRLAVHYTDTGTVDYLREKYAAGFFNNEEKEFGRSIHEDGPDCEYNLVVGKDNDKKARILYKNVGFFNFCIPLIDVADFRKEMKKRNVRWGVYLQENQGMSSSHYVKLCTLLYNMPIVENYVLKKNALALSFHRDSFCGNRYEHRWFDKGGFGICVAGPAWQPLAGSYKLAELAITHYPLNLLYEEGHMVNNDED